MSTVPVPAGLAAVISVAETTTTVVAASEPKSTSAAETKPEPVIVTVVPPARTPDEGLTEPTTGVVSGVTT
jgi:hypothetical protein